MAIYEFMNLKSEMNKEDYPEKLLIYSDGNELIVKIMN